MSSSNGTSKGLLGGSCPLSKAYIDEPNIEKPLFGSTTFQDLSMYISGGISILTLLIAVSLMLRHLFCYTRPREQRQIIRIVFGPALFSVLSFLSIWSYPDSLFLEPAQDLYEPVTLAGIFLLFTEFADPNEQTRESYFAQLENRKKRGGRFSFKKGYEIVSGGCSRWYHSKYVAIFWYFIASVVIRIVEEATQAHGRYCSSSFSPEFAHVWVLVISNVALPVGIAAVLQFYWRLRTEPHFKAHHTLNKLLSFKAVILIRFFQEIIFDILTGTHALKTNAAGTVTYKDLSIALPNLLTCFEQLIVAIWYHWSFSVSDYSSFKDKPNRLGVFRATANALNPSDLFLMCLYGATLMFKGVGPRGNGSWRRNGGYDKVYKDEALKHLEPSPERSFERSPSPAPRPYDSRPPVYDTSYGYHNVLGEHEEEKDVNYVVLQPSREQV